MTSEHASIAAFRQAHEARGGTGDIVILPDAAHTAALAAAALGCEVGAIANSLLFEAVGPDGDRAPVLILTSGAHRVDVALAAERIGVTRLKRATPEFVREHTGQVIGGVSPLGHPAPVPTYLDRALSRYPVVWAAAGHPASVFSTTYAELLTMTVPPGSHLNAVSIVELRLPEPSAVTLIFRDDSTFVPGEDTTLRLGDELLIVTTRGRREATERRLRAVTRAGPLAHWFDEYGDAD